MNGELAQPFVWRDVESNTSVIAAFHPGGYGTLGTPQDPTRFGPTTCDCLATEGLDEVLCYAWHGTNTEVPTIPHIAQDFAALKTTFPNAVVVPSTFDEFYTKLNDPAIRS